MNQKWRKGLKCHAMFSSMYRISTCAVRLYVYIDINCSICINWTKIRNTCTHKGSFLSSVKLSLVEGQMRFRQEYICLSRLAPLEDMVSTFLSSTVCIIQVRERSREKQSTSEYHNYVSQSIRYLTYMVILQSQLCPYASCFFSDR